MTYTIFDLTFAFQPAFSILAVPNLKFKRPGWVRIFRWTFFQKIRENKKCQNSKHNYTNITSISRFFCQHQFEFPCDLVWFGDFFWKSGKTKSVKTANVNVTSISRFFWAIVIPFHFDDLLIYRHTNQRNPQFSFLSFCLTFSSLEA